MFINVGQLNKSALCSTQNNYHTSVGDLLLIRILVFLPRLPYHDWWMVLRVRLRSGCGQETCTWGSYGGAEAGPSGATSLGPYGCFGVEKKGFHFFPLSSHHHQDTNVLCLAVEQYIQPNIACLTKNKKRNGNKPCGSAVPRTHRSGRTPLCLAHSLIWIYSFLCFSFSFIVANTDYVTMSALYKSRWQTLQTSEVLKIKYFNFSLLGRLYTNIGSNLGSYWRTNGKSMTNRKL